MTKLLRLQVAALGIVLVAAACGDGGGATESATAGGTVSETRGTACPTEGDQLDTALLYIEHNATDGDTGVHGLFGGEAWRELCVWDPAGTLVMEISPAAQLREMAVADVFFESREPPNDEVAIADVVAAFPAGEYIIGGTDFEGTPRVASAVFTHAIPAEPEIVFPEVTDEESAADVVVDTSSLVIEWLPVTETIEGGSVDISAYEVIVTKTVHDDADSRSQPVHDVIVGPDATSLAVPSSFFASGETYELEILALEVSGNQTIGLGFFTAG